MTFNSANLFETVTTGVVILGFCMIGITALRTTLAIYAVQTVILGFLASWKGLNHSESTLIFAGIGIILIKGFAAPIYLSIVSKKIGCREDKGVLIAPSFLMLLSSLAAAFLVLAPASEKWIPSDAFPALGLILVGMLFMVTRRIAVNQIVGFLLLENGIFLYTLMQPHAMPLLVELGALLDILAGTMFSGVLLFHINDRFEHIDVTALKELQG